MNITPTYETEPNAENYPAVVTRLQAEIARLEAELAEANEKVDLERQAWDSLAEHCDVHERLLARERDQARRVAAQLLRVARALLRDRKVEDREAYSWWPHWDIEADAALAALEPGVRKMVEG